MYLSQVRSPYEPCQYYVIHLFFSSTSLTANHINVILTMAFSKYQVTPNITSKRTNWKCEKKWSFWMSWWHDRRFYMGPPRLVVFLDKFQFMFLFNFFCFFQMRYKRSPFMTLEAVKKLKGCGLNLAVKAKTRLCSFCLYLVMMKCLGEDRIPVNY